MNFSTLEICRNECLGEPDLRIENKQSINLSKHAYDVILQDVDMFHVKEDNKKLKENGIPSQFFNQVFHCFHETARSSISVMLDKRRMDLERLFSQIPQDQTRSDITQRILDTYRDELIDESMRRRKEKKYSLSFRMDTETIEYLTSEQGGKKESEYYQDRIGEYFKALMEEYADLSNVRRDELFHKDILDEIHLAIASKTMLTMKLRNKRGSKTSSSFFTTYFKPMNILQDSEHLYNYMVGFRSDDKCGTWTQSTIRINSILSCRQLQQKAFISKDDQKALDAAIVSNGVQFISSSDVPHKIVVRFTPYGLGMYNSIFHLRPMYVKKLDEFTYEFFCTSFSASVYFFKFGKDARIIEPQQLATAFIKKYQEALNAYTTPQDD